MIAQERKFEPVAFQWQGKSKTEITQVAATMIEIIEEHGGPLEIAERLSAMELFIKELKANPRYAGYVLEELSKSGGKLTTASGAKIETMEGGTKYFYDKCGDPVLVELEQKAVALKEAIEVRQKFLKCLPTEGSDQIVDGGEVVRIYPPYKTSTSTYKVTLAK